MSSTHSAGKPFTLVDEVAILRDPQRSLSPGGIQVVPGQHHTSLDAICQQPGPVFPEVDKHFLWQRGGWPERVEEVSKQDFGSIDVPDPTHHGLIHQHHANGSRRRGHSFHELALTTNSPVEEGIRAEPGDNGRCFFGRVDFTGGGTPKIRHDL